MFNADEVANALFEEARRWLVSAVEASNPHADLEVCWREDVEHLPLPTLPQLASVVEEVFWCSLMEDEGRPCRPRLIYMPTLGSGIYAEGTARFHTLASALPATRHILRKISAAVAASGYLVWRVEDGVPVIVGVLPGHEENGGWAYLIVEATGNGALDLRRLARLVLVRAGEIFRQSSYPNPGDGQIFTHLYFELAGPQAAYGFGPIVQEILRRRHGGSVWFLPNGVKPEGLKVDYSIGDPQNAPSIPNDPRIRRRWLQSIGSLAAVDGAVLVDCEMRVIGFGAFIMNVETVNVKRMQPPNEGKIIELATVGGARHRAAAAFCSRYGPGATAIVVSHDGRVSLFGRSKDPNDIEPYYAEIFDLGMRP